ncbi:MAG TPA: CorA family divalent cation transporter [Azospirillaceae bacterium]|nr:CorA family divalent cation transporter [Azospirillaceae bacterium]
MGAPLATDTDLICGYVLEPNGGLTRLKPGAPPPQATAEGEGLLWLHFNLSSIRARSWIEQQSGLPEVVREILLDAEDTRTRVEPVGDALVAVLSDMHYDFDYDPSDIGTLRLYLDRNRVVSCRRHPLKAVDRLRLGLERGERYDTTAELFAELLDKLADTLGEVVGKLSEEVDDIEEDILAERFLDHRVKLGKVRRLAVRLRRHIVPQRQALAKLVAGRRLPWLSDEDMVRLRDASETLGGVILDLDSTQERAKLLQDELASRLTEETNRTLFVLSLVTVLFAPLTFVTGVFGMNVAGLPGLHAPSAFWWVMLLMAGVGVATLLFLRRRG